MDELDIGQVARLSGYPPSTLRYYEQKGLISSIGRNGLRRVFPVAVLQKLELISLAQLAGFALDDIADLLGGEHGIDRHRLRARARLIDRQIARLANVRDKLLRTANCAEQDHLQCASFRRLLATAHRQHKDDGGRGNIPPTSRRPAKRRIITAR